ncbi:MAG: hypothetical protein Q8Q73_19095 [Stagnimonas sp.]|nr:hypothetical protein [Stagnimonas sp.]
MSAICECGWTGPSTRVRDGGRCPECMSRVRYESKPLIETPKLDVEGFNHRAARTLRAVPGTDANQFLVGVLPLCEKVIRLTALQQNGIYKAILRHEQAIADRALLDFATMHARGAD